MDKFSLAISLSKGYNKDIIKHISASGGFIQGIQLDMVRIGILLYGYAPFENDYIKVKPAMKVLAPIIARRTLQSGDTIMYGKEKNRFIRYKTK